AKWSFYVASGYFLEGSMIPRSEARSIDERAELRSPSASSTAVLEFRGRKHVVRLINVSSSGAMVLFPHVPNIGERLPLPVLDRVRERLHGGCGGAVRRRLAGLADASRPRARQRGGQMDRWREAWG